VVGPAVDRGVAVRSSSLRTRWIPDFPSLDRALVEIPLESLIGFFRGDS
jgi:hypothetical protein